ncbi:hypothetical protein GOP47_0015522 [Adiantum capillus-veneris]|uniref:Uncharacterized protein n=1 Tax=Adiantum capillus-veneris TaxID=13818 RepID=A0A9D4ZE18_ADICA|nr:hypothetical protein GOP47_0015522 [Adiantum capillus-veneris]
MPIVSGTSYALCRIACSWRRKGLAIINAVMAAPPLILAALLLIVAAGSYELYSTVPFAVLLTTCKGLPSCSQQQPSMAQPCSKGTQFLELLRLNGSSACHHVRTHHALALGLPSEGKLLRLRTGHPFTFHLISVAKNGTQRCSGGDFYETQLAGTHWMSRPPVVDMGDGYGGCKERY